MGKSECGGLTAWTFLNFLLKLNMAITNIWIKVVCMTGWFHPFFFPMHPSHSLCFCWYWLIMGYVVKFHWLITFFTWFSWAVELSDYKLLVIRQVQTVWVFQIGKLSNKFALLRTNQILSSNILLTQLPMFQNLTRFHNTKSFFSMTERQLSNNLELH